MPDIAPEAKFMGQVTAQSMHEMQNILAIIHESAGLLGDILKVNAKVDFKHRPKMESTLEHIFAQVRRGKSLLHATSRLAHSPDDDLVESCDLAVQGAISVQLSERMVRLRGGDIAFTAPTESMPVQAGALSVLMAGYQGLQWAAGGISNASHIRVVLETAGANGVMRIEPSPGSTPDPTALDGLHRLLGADRVRLDDKTLRLLFPASA